MSLISAPIRRKLREAARLIVLSMLAIALAPGALSAPTVREHHKEWTVVCDTPENPELANEGQEICLIVQQKNLKESNQPILRVEVGVALETGKAFAVITAPLGVFLPGGLTMAIDDGAVQSLAYSSCVANGCIVGLNLADEQLAALKHGEEAKFTFQDGRRRNITVPVSLQGFTAAIDAINP